MRIDGAMVYEWMIGVADRTQCPLPAELEIVDEFSDGMPCQQWGEELYEQKAELAQQLTREQQITLERMEELQAKIMGYLCRKSYEYGRKMPDREI